MWLPKCISLREPNGTLVSHNFKSFTYAWLSTELMYECYDKVQYLPCLESCWETVKAMCTYGDCMKMQLEDSSLMYTIDTL